MPRNFDEIVEALDAENDDEDMSLQTLQKLYDELEALPTTEQWKIDDLFKKSERYRAQYRRVTGRTRVRNNNIAQ